MPAIVLEAFQLPQSTATVWRLGMLFCMSETNRRSRASLISVSPFSVFLCYFTPYHLSKSLLLILSTMPSYYPHTLSSCTCSPLLSCYPSPPPEHTSSTQFNVTQPLHPDERDEPPPTKLSYKHRNKPLILPRSREEPFRRCSIL